MPSRAAFSFCHRASLHKHCASPSERDLFQACNTPIAARRFLWLALTARKA
jgi:hypothetical protein